MTTPRINKKSRFTKRNTTLVGESDLRYGSKELRVEAPAYVVGCAAVHRAYNWHTLKPRRNGWRITHTPSGWAVANWRALPFYLCKRYARLIAWAIGDERDPVAASANPRFRKVCMAIALHYPNQPKRASK
jgi:hypothetical protein